VADSKDEEKPAPKASSLAASLDKKAAAKKKKKTGSVAQEELRNLVKERERPPVDLSKMYVRTGAAVAVGWILAIGVSTWLRTWIPLGVAGLLTAILAGVAVWLVRYTKRTQAIGELLRGADTKEARAAALEKLKTDFKGDTQAVIARAQLEMQENPRKALETLEGVDLDKQLAPVADQVRAMRAMIHLTLGEAQAARALADKLDLGKQQDAKTRAMFATVAAEAWARTGLGQKAIDTLDLFDPEAPDVEEMRIQMYRARAFACAAVSDIKGCERALKKLADTNPQLMAMFVGQKKIHPLLERSAKQILLRSGAIPRKMVRQRV
jgi:hypothetical protein